MDLVWKTRAFLLALLCTTSLLSAQQWDKITLDFQEVLNQQSQPTYKAYALLHDRVDIRALEADFRARQLPVDERARIVVQSLTAKAAATQPALLQSLRGIEGITSGSLQPFWITNMVFFEGSRAAIFAVSQLPAVASVGYDAPVEWIEAEHAPVPVPPSPNGTETGLEAIGAPELWAMGYTGYGTRALIVDTGTEPDHPALANQFLYHLQSQSSSFVGEDVIDCNGHGTHVAGTILGLDRLTHDTIGVAFEAKWMSGIAVSGDCGGNTSTAGITGMYQWALNPDGDPSTTTDIPHVINNSWRSGSTFCDADGVFETYDALYAAGIAVVFSAGNSGPEPQTITPPKFNNWDLVRLFSVGNLNANNSNLPISSGSSRGPSICGGIGSLLIKPEVSAPGSSVRSAYVGGGYASLSGTSMAAPHVSGAILLLKEAFPYLTGEDLMLALYHSATDLGTPGEDNDYGMGIINLPAAYQYLVDEGNVPEAPRSFEGNARVLQVSAPEYNCGNTVQLSATVYYEGPDTLQELVMTYRIGDAPEQTYEWTGQALPGQPHIIELPAAVMPEGTYEAELTLLSANGLADERPEDNTLKTTVSVLDETNAPAVLAGDSICAGHNALVHVLTNGTAEVKWYNNATGGTSIGSGSPFLLEGLTESRVIYAETAPVRKVGKPDNSGSNTQYSNQVRGLRFNALHPFTLRSVKVYAEEQGGRLLQLVKPDGGITTKIINVAAGEQRVELNIDISPGEGYILRLNAGKPLQLNAGAFQGYPMTVPGVVSITSSTLGSSAYFYFYDWEVSYKERCGRSALEIPVSATAGAAEDLVISSSTDTVDLAVSGTVTFSTLTEGYTSWNWQFGNGQQVSGASVAYTFDRTGIYTVGLSAQTVEGCTNASVKEIVVVDNTPPVSTQTLDQEPALLIFPNPAKDQVNLLLETGLLREARITLTDMLGRPLSQQVQDLGAGQTATLSLAVFPTGTYIIIVETEGKRSVHRIVKAKSF
ncbi:MAG: S8 family serine peptidase [Phaeodactylibacter sp.]|uniref:S8 family serine peptidase n=1 Tax=Phaeodactylibacter sp. TaxID=1940289 RepID=UPI0032EF1E5A